MGRLERIEQRLESAVNGTFSRLFRSDVQPVELFAALQREVDRSAQTISRSSALAPNQFVIRLSAKDYDRLAAYEDTLVSEMTTLLLEHSQMQRYAFPGDIRIRLARDDALRSGQFQVDSAARAGVSSPGVQRPRPPDHGTPAYLSVDGTVVPVTPPGLLVGRTSECDLRLDDQGVSRRHAELRVIGQGRDADVVIVDLGSMNGTLVDGERVVQARLSDGSQVTLGSTTIRVHRDDPRGPHGSAAPSVGG